jgi:hypothetical protein
LIGFFVESRFAMKITTVFRCALLTVLFLPAVLPYRSPSVTEKTPVSAPEFERSDKLQAASDALLTLFDRMPSVPIYLKDEPILKTGASTEKGVGYTHCDGGEIPSIFIKKAFYQKANQKQLVNILKHELTHAWLCRQRLMSGHDERFREKFKQVGGFGN